MTHHGLHRPPAPAYPGDLTPGLARALDLVREEARSFPGSEGVAAIFAVTRSIERELARLGGSGSATSGARSGVSG